MRKKKPEHKKTNHWIAFTLSILMVGGIVGFSMKFGHAWVEPPSAATPPGGDIAAPINTGATTQTKVGGDICVDTNGDGTADACLSSGGNAPVGTVVMWSGTLSTIPSGWALCNGRNGTPDLRNRFVYGVSSAENPGATGGSEYASVSLGGRNDIRFGANGPWAVNSVSVYAMPPYYKLAFIMKEGVGWVNTDLTGGDHNQSDCTSAGGTMDTTNNICIIDGNSCPSGWTQYQNWTDTSSKTCNGSSTGGCTPVTSCSTGEHAWANTPRENCSFNNNYLNSGTTFSPKPVCLLYDYENNWFPVCDPAPYLSMGGYYCVWQADPNNNFGCGIYTPYSYCAVSPGTCWSDITRIGCI